LRNFGKQTESVLGQWAMWLNTRESGGVYQRLCCYQMLKCGIGRTRDLLAQVFTSFIKCAPILSTLVPFEWRLVEPIWTRIWRAESINSWRPFILYLRNRIFAYQNVCRIEEEMAVSRGWVGEYGRWGTSSTLKFLGFCRGPKWFWIFVQQDGSRPVYQTRLFVFEFPHHILQLVAVDSCCDRRTWSMKSWWITPAADHQTLTISFFRRRLCFGLWIGASFVSPRLAERLWLSFGIPLSSQVTIRLK